MTFCIFMVLLIWHHNCLLGYIYRRKLTEPTFDKSGHEDRLVSVFSRVVVLICFLPSYYKIAVILYYRSWILLLKLKATNAQWNWLMVRIWNRTVTSNPLKPSTCYHTGPPQPPVLCHVLFVLYECHTDGILQYVIFDTRIFLCWEFLSRVDIEVHHMIYLH